MFSAGIFGNIEIQLRPFVRGETNSLTAEDGAEFTAKRVPINVTRPWKETIFSRRKIFLNVLQMHIDEENMRNFVASLNPRAVTHVAKTFFRPEGSIRAFSPQIHLFAFAKMKGGTRNRRMCFFPRCIFILSNCQPFDRTVMWIPAVCLAVLLRIAQNCEFCKLFPHKSWTLWRQLKWKCRALDIFFL